MSKEGKPPCRHCHEKKSNRPKGLCWHCWHVPEIYALYPSTSKFSRRGPGQGCGGHTLPTPVMEAMPGSKEKLRLLEERAEQGVSLFHPDEPYERIPRSKSHQQSEGVRVVKSYSTHAVEFDRTCRRRSHVRNQD